MFYIHIPYCKGKCIYCDFYSSGSSNRKEFIKALVAELSLRRKELDKCLSSIYIGGGTPSLLTHEEFSLLSSELDSFFKSEGVTFSEDFEFTVEVNPEDVTEELIETWKAAGVNRLSMGIQSLDDEELRFLHRRHDSHKALQSIEMVAENFDNFSLDFIYGIPGQTLDTLNESLSRALDFKPPHISVYVLTFEEKTPLNVLREQGRIHPSSDDLYNRMDSAIAEQLQRSGMERYEISNYALPGFRARHNSGYWKFRPYLGLGPSAASFNGLNVRRTNPSKLKDYIKYFTSSGNKLQPFYEEEILDEESRLIETVMVSLRCREGIDLKQFSCNFGKDRLHELMVSSENFLKSGALLLKDERLMLSSNGISISDYIIRSLI